MSGRRRILHLIKGLGRGGAERLLSEGLRHANRERFDYAYGYFLPHKDALVPELRALGAQVHHFPARTGAGVLFQCLALTRFLRRWRPDLVHCHLPLAGVAGRLAGLRAGTPVIYTEHNLLEHYHPWTRRAALWTWHFQQRVLAVSDDVAASIRRHAPDRVPVQVVRNGIDVAAFEPDPSAVAAVRRRWGIPEPAPLVGQVAVFRRQKRLDLWLEAAAEIRRRIPDTRFLLVGDGPTRSEIEARARELALTDALTLPGLQDEVAPLLGAMDVFLVSSDFEGLPLAVLEAMAARRPVVATAVGGLPEVLQDDGEGSDEVGADTCGVLVPPGDPAALAKAVAGILADPSRARLLGEQAHRRVALQFSLSRMTAELEAVYRRVLAEDDLGVPR